MVRIEAIAVDVRPSRLQAFLRYERLTGITVTHLTEGEYRTAYHDEVKPGIDLRHGQQVVETFAAGGIPVPGRRSTAAIVPTVRRLVALAAVTPRTVRRP